MGSSLPLVAGRAYCEPAAVSVNTLMKIRAYNENDKNEVISLWGDCGLTVAQNDAAKDIERKLKVDPDLFLVGVSESEIVASVMGGYEGHRGWINYLAVKPSEQRKGYGQAIMQAVEILLKGKGCPKINLQVRSANESVIAFYSAMGYENDNVVGLGKRLEYDS
ncbi:GNAT family acetyltransferase [Congregibacter litoralis]|uniref:Acetyltransferase n=1 Tax=Congregibacter litoralis KT71 TaxID=314285 RepID=A4A4P1_9GAMM|nr:GNAT family acetyltransferase [Congregibacter litoralis]EAQ98762.1 Acetyltransferase [Congregibacter litoralis KT71]